MVDDDPTQPGSQITETLGGPNRFGDEDAPTPVALPLTAVVTLTDDAEAEDCVAFDVSVESQLEVYTGGDRWDHWFSGLTACTLPQNPALHVYALSPTPSDLRRYDTDNPYPHEDCETELVVLPAGRNMVCVERHDASSVVKQLKFGISEPVPLSEPLSATDQRGPRSAPERVLPFTEQVAFDGRFDLDCFSTTATAAGYVSADLCGAGNDSKLSPRVVKSADSLAMDVSSSSDLEYFGSVDCGGALGLGPHASFPVVSGQTVLVCAQALPAFVDGGRGELRVALTQQF